MDKGQGQEWTRWTSWTQMDASLWTEWTRTAENLSIRPSNGKSIPSILVHDVHSCPCP
jgi:hypothetical protein